MVDLRWDGDERGEGVADATAFAAGAVELVDAMRLPRWVAEEPEMHLLPHIERACQALPFEIESADVTAEGSYDLRLSWTDQARPVAPLIRRPAAQLLALQHRLGVLAFDAAEVYLRAANQIWQDAWRPRRVSKT